MYCELHHLKIARNLFDDIFDDLRVYPSHYDEGFRNESLHRAGDMTCIINDHEITMNASLMVIS